MHRLMHCTSRVHRTFVRKIRKCLLQHVQCGRLPTEGQAHQHHTVAHELRLIELDDLVNEVGVRLAEDLCQMPRKLGDQQIVVGFGRVTPGKRSFVIPV